MTCFLTLQQMQPGECGKIVELDTDDRAILGKLMSLGIIPGITITLLRLYPGIVVQAGFTKAALDRSFARFIYVLKPR